MPDITEPDLSEVFLPAPGLDTEAEMQAIVARYIGASGVLIQLVTFVGGQVGDVVSRLPKGTQSRIDDMTRIALETAYGAAKGSHRKRPGGDRAHRRAAAAFGAVGGLGGLPSALAELPVTTTAILRSIQEIARFYGEDLSTEETRAACLQVLGAGGPLAEDDAADFAFLGARMTLTGPAINNLIAQIAPRFAAIMSQRLATMAVPVLGAAAGAGTNLAFMRYYQDMAHVHFGLRRLARYGALEAPAVFKARVENARAIRKV